MSDITDSDITKPTLGKSGSNESALLKTVRLTINLLTNILMCLTVFVSLLYGFSAEKITAFQLHIILCVLGCQLFMCQGILVMSKYNSWSMHLNRRHRKYLHIWFQILGFVLVIVGSSVLMVKSQRHFGSTHGSLGVIALIISLISILNGALANYAYKLSRAHTLIIKFIHYTSGILTLLLSAAALSTGFEKFSFRIWVKNEQAIAGLICITWAFTLLVTLDFWLLSGQRLRNLV